VKICVFGSGAIGGFVAASLARAGQRVNAVARGAQLAAIRSRGLAVRIAGEEFRVELDASDNASDFGVQDIVFVTVKAPALETAVKAMAPLLGARTTVVFLMNGIPWWYYFNHGGPDDGRDMPRLDPNGTIRSIAGPERTIGGIAYCSATVAEPGTIDIDYPDARFEFGEPDGTMSERVRGVVGLLRNAKLDAIAVANIRERIWAKLVLNMTTGPMAVMAGVRLKDLFESAEVQEAARTILSEGLAIARSLGMRVDIDSAAVIDKLRKSGHKPSILQDFEAGRPMEIDALYTVALDMGRANGVKTPTLDLLVHLVKLRARAAGLY